MRKLKTKDNMKKAEHNGVYELRIRPSESRDQIEVSFSQKAASIKAVEHHDTMSILIGISGVAYIRPESVIALRDACNVYLNRKTADGKPAKYLRK
jgi:hypothetical protein